MYKAGPIAVLHSASRELTRALDVVTLSGETRVAWSGGQQLVRDPGSGNSDTRLSSQPNSQQGSKNKGSGESFDPKTAFVVDLPVSDVCTRPSSPSLAQRTLKNSARYGRNLKAGEQLHYLLLLCGSPAQA